MITKEQMGHMATRAFVIEEMIETAYGLAETIENERMGNAEYRLRHLLHGASELAGALAHALSDSMSGCAAQEVGSSEAGT